MLRYSPLLVFGAIVMVFAYVLLFPAKEGEKSIASASVRMLPDFSLPSYEDASINISKNDIKGPAIINLFASWCAPCVAEYPLLAEISRTHNIPVYGFAWKDKREALHKQFLSHPSPYNRIMMDDKGSFLISLAVHGVPETFVINAEGAIIFRNPGPLTREQVKTSGLESLLEEIGH